MRPCIDATDAFAMVDAVQSVHLRIRDIVTRSMATSPAHLLRQPDDSLAGDTIYAIDRVGEQALLELLEEHLARWLPLVVVAEGLADTGHGPGIAVLPTGAPFASAGFRVVVDPIDGTRGLMYGKRSAWILTGIATQSGPPGRVPTLRDIDVAVQTEVPTRKQILADTLSAVRGRGACGKRTNLESVESHPFDLAPSTASSIEHGFGQVMRAFPGGRDLRPICVHCSHQYCIGAGSRGHCAVILTTFALH